MRLGECLRLRVKDIRFELMRIEVHDSKGGKSRLVPLPVLVVDPLRRLVKSRGALYERPRFLTSTFRVGFWRRPLKTLVSRLSFGRWPDLKWVLSCF